MSAPIRIRTESVLTSDVLDRFVSMRDKMGSYFLVPATSDGRGGLTIGWDLMIRKRKLTVKPVWQVSLDDIDRVALRPGDQPVIPDDVKRPPVQDVLDLLSGEAQ